MVPNTLFSFLAAASLPFVCAVDLYLYPARNYAAGIRSLEDASAAVSRHLGLDMFEQVNDGSNASFYQEDFVGKGMEDSIPLTMNELDAQVVLPAELGERASVEHVKSPNNIDSLAPVVSTYLNRAGRIYASVFSPETAWQLTKSEDLSSFLDSAPKPAFAALEVSKLQNLREKYGSQSNQYETFAAEIRELLEVLLHDRPNVNIAILTYLSSPLQARQSKPRQSQAPFPERPLPQEPIGAISTCFSSLGECENSTDTCSGHGNCVEATKSGRTCFVCACGVTKTGEGSKIKTERWAGESCERKDVSGPFVLLAGSIIVLLVVGVGAISLLYTVGEQALPSILLATAVNSKKD